MGAGGYFLICCCEEYVLVCGETLGLLSAKAFLTAFVCWLFSSYISPTLLMAKIKSRLNWESKNPTKTVDSNSRSELFSWMSFVFFFLFLGLEISAVATSI